jgi:hypothetical protein
MMKPEDNMVPELWRAMMIERLVLDISHNTAPIDLKELAVLDDVVE